MLRAVQLRRIPRLLVGLWIFGVGIAMILMGDFGLPPWDVLHQGIQEQSPLSIGTAIIVVGACLVAVMALLREPIGIGTVANVLVIGVAVDVTLWMFDDPTSTFGRAAATLAGPAVIAVGSGLYLGVHLGSGPRDGMMTALGRRGVTIWKARLAVEAVALGGGLLLGGSVGWGTIWFLVSIGPLVQLSLARLSLPVTEPAT
ncbi:MAG: putative membrane protein YczE [Candidatus Aldehydirespiratoraceae bacterium]